MWRLYTPLKWLWGTVTLALVTNIASSRLFGIFLPSVSAFIWANLWWELPLVLIIVALTIGAFLSQRGKYRREEIQRKWQQQQHEHRERAEKQRLLRHQFALLKDAIELQPEDFGFQVLSPGQPPSIEARPFYSAYIPRRIVPHHTTTGIPSASQYTEDTLVQALHQGKGFVLIGQPLDGKSRTLYEILKRLAGYQVIKPLKSRPLPPDEAFRILTGQPVILFIEDLNDYADAVLDLHEFRATLGRYTDRFVVVATCRDGPELSVVGQNVTTGLRRFYGDIPLKLTFLPPTADQKNQLAQFLGKQFAPHLSTSFPTLGSITMTDPLRAMRHRFDALRPEEQDTLRAFKLLATAGVLPFSHKRLIAVLHSIFSRTPHLGDCLDTLAEHSFLRRPARQDPVIPEPAYLLQAVAYLEGKKLEDDFGALVAVLADLKDAMGLVYLGNSYGMPPLNDEEQAMVCFERALTLDSCNLPALYNKAALLAKRDHLSDALNLLQRLIALYPNFPEAYYTLGAVRARLNDRHAAIEAIQKAIQFRPHDALLWAYKGGQLLALKRYEEALEAYDQALHLESNFPRAWGFKGIILAKLGRRTDALEWLCRAWRARAQLPHEDMATIADFLQVLGRHPDECEKTLPGPI